MHKNIIKFILIGIFLISNLQAYESITIGTIDTNPEDKLSKFEAISKYLQKKLNNNIIVNVEIPINIDTAVNLIKSNKLDIFIDSVYPTLLIQKRSGLSIEAKRWKKGYEGYRSLIFTKKESKIDSIQDLKNKTIAFEDEFSTSAYYIPKKAIEKEGLNLSNNNSNSIKYLFSRSETNSAVWVLFKKVDAAATDDITYKALNKNQYKIIYQSDLIPRQLVSFSKKISPELKNEILNILFNMHKNKEGKKVLELFSKTKKFTKLKKDDLKILEWK